MHRYCYTIPTMEFRKPSATVQIIGNLRYRTEGSTLLAVFISDELEKKYWYIFRTQKGSYFLQKDERDISRIELLSLGDAARYYEMSQFRIVTPFPENLMRD